MSDVIVCETQSYHLGTYGMSDAEVKAKILELLSSINREGMKELIDFLKYDSDYFTAPASTKYHLSCEAGLARHVLNLYYELKKRNEEVLWFTEEEIIIIALLHDLAKINSYYRGKGNIKKYSYKETIALPHGVKSVYYATQFIKLYKKEFECIVNHMGMFDDAINNNQMLRNYISSEAKYCVLVSQCDEWVSKLE